MPIDQTTDKLTEKFVSWRENETAIYESAPDIDWDDNQNSDVIYEFFTGQTRMGKDFYAYLAIPSKKHAHFVRSVASGEVVNLNFFGEILESGFGSTPSKEIKKKMADKYGI